MGARRIACCVLALLAGCAQVVRPPSPNAPPQPTATVPGYEIVEGRGPDVVARLRAAPPPSNPDVADGSTQSGDEALLRAQGLVKIGVGHYPGDDVARLRDAVSRQAQKAGADKALVYPSQTVGALATALFFVRLHLPFGANFRDLTDAERQSLGSGGVEIGEIVGGTPASAANLRDGDYVLLFNKTPVSDKTQFQSLLQEHMGRRVMLTIHRDGTTMKRLVVLGTLAPAGGH